MWDGRLGRTNTAKHKIKFFEPSKRPDLPALYRTGLVTSKFEEVEIDKEIYENITEPAQTE